MDITRKRAEGIRRYLPVLSWLPGYQMQWLGADLVAGLTIMALLVPEGMAYAQLAGMPPQAAFYAAPIGLILYALFGTSRHLVVAVSSAVAVMSASIVGGLAPAGTEQFIILTAALAIMAGFVSVLAGVLRLGRISQFFSESVLTGFVSGLALVIMIKQVPKLFGLEPVEGNFWIRVIDLLREMPDTHLLTLAVGLSSLVLMVIIEHRLKRIPAALVILIYGIAVVSIFDLAARQVEVIGEIPAGLALPGLPDVTLQDLVSLIPGALAITLVVFSEAIGPDRSLARKHRYTINEDQELIGLGMANIGAGLFQGFPIGASLSKSAASDAAGGKTQLAGIVAAIATALVALFLTPLFFNLPEAALAAIVIVAVSGMFKPREFVRLYRLRRGDFWLSVIAFLGVLTFNEVLVGLLIAVVVSLLALIIRTSEPRLSVLGRIPGTLSYYAIQRHPDAVQDPGLLILRPDEGLFFANAAPLHQAIMRSISTRDKPPRSLILDLQMTSELDVPSVEIIRELYEELQGFQIRLMLAGLHAGVRDMLDRSEVGKVVGRQNYYPTVLEAVLVYTHEHLDELSPDDVNTIIKRINELSEIISITTKDVSEDQRKELARILGEFGQIRADLDSRGQDLPADGES